MGMSIPRLSAIITLQLFLSCFADNSQKLVQTHVQFCTRTLHHAFTHIYMCVCVYIYIYIYRERERERESCATSQKVAGYIPDEVIGFFYYWSNPSSCIMAQGFTASIRCEYQESFWRSKELWACKADNLTVICKPTVQKMCDPRRLTILWPYTAYYRDNFTFYFYFHLKISNRHLWTDCLDNVGTSTSHNPMGLEGLSEGYIYFFTFISTSKFNTNSFSVGKIYSRF
jgi:hypothetical protein